MATMHCEVLTPSRRFFSGEVESLLFVTHDGEIEILAAHFKVPKSSVAIVGGFKSKNKIVRIGACPC